MIRRVLVVAAIAASVCAPAHGQTYDMRAPLPASCGAWTAARRGDNPRLAELHYTWILGWLSAASFRSNRRLMANQDDEALKAWLDNYCAGHPLANISDAAIELEAVLAGLAPPSRP